MRAEDCLPDRVVHALNAIPVCRPVVNGVELGIDENFVRPLLGDEAVDEVIRRAAERIEPKENAR